MRTITEKAVDRFHGAKSSIFDLKASSMIVAPHSRIADVDTIGTRIRALREAAGLTQQQLGKLARVSKQAISAIERDETLSPRPRVLFAIAKVLDADPESLVEQSNAVREDRGGYAGPIDKREAILLRNFRRAEEVGKLAVEGAAAAVAQGRPPIPA